MQEHEPLKGRVSIVTGGAQGLGKATAHLLAERGSIVVVADRNDESGKAVAASIRDGGGEAVFEHLDVSDEAQWEALVARIMASFSKVDVLVNNAAVALFALMNEMSVEMFTRITDVNIKGVFLGCKHVLPAMRVTGAGSIINVSSVAGMVANMPTTSAYAASKGAVRLLTKGVAHDYARHNIRANSVHPGGMLTEMAIAVHDNPETRHLVVGGALNDRAADPREVAMAIAFLASDDASYVNGSELVVDGGWLAH